jgi:hypothetical protein
VFSERAERLAGRIGGSLLFALAIYVVGSAGWSFWTREGAKFSIAGLVVSLLAIPIMHYLARRKIALAERLGSRPCGPMPWRALPAAGSPLSSLRALWRKPHLASGGSPLLVRRPSCGFWSKKAGRLGLATSAGALDVAYQSPPPRHWRSYGDHQLPTPADALAEPFAAFPSWFLRIECDRCGKGTMLNGERRRNLPLNALLTRMRHDGCGGLRCGGSCCGQAKGMWRWTLLAVAVVGALVLAGPHVWKFYVGGSRANDSVIQPSIGGDFCIWT